MAEFLNLLQSIAVGFGLVIVGLLCIAGLVLSCLSISGTWLVVAGAVLAAIIRSEPFPGLWTVLVFIALAILVEAVEAVAGAFGVRKRRGSKLAGLAAVVGGLLGLALGTLIPVPVLGSLLGMLTGSFGLVFAVEACRLKQANRAVGIAWGTVLARVFVILVKVSVTLGMAGYLLLGMLIRS